LVNQVGLRRTRKYLLSFKSLIVRRERSGPIISTLILVAFNILVTVVGDAKNNLGGGRATRLSA